MDETHILDKQKFIKNYIKTQASHEVTTEIIMILNKTGVVHSKNQNGMFYNLSLMKKEIIDQLYHLCQSNIISVKDTSPIFTKKNTITHELEDDFSGSVDKLLISQLDNFILDLSKEHLRI